jgi:hypothetical protein
MQWCCPGAVSDVDVHPLCQQHLDELHIATYYCVVQNWHRVSYTRPAIPNRLVVKIGAYWSIRCYPARSDRIPY